MPQPYAIIDGIRMDRNDIEHLLSVLDPKADPETWNYLYMNWNTLIKKERDNK